MGGRGKKKGQSKNTPNWTPTTYLRSPLLADPFNLLSPAGNLFHPPLLWTKPLKTVCAQLKSDLLEPKRSVELEDLEKGGKAATSCRVLYCNCFSLLQPDLLGLRPLG